MFESFTGFRSLAAMFLSLGLVLTACGTEDGEESADEPTSGVDEATNSDPSAGDDDVDFAGTASDDDLLVPRDYLQGQWCASDGNEWKIEGDDASFVELSSGGSLETIVDIAFIDTLDTSLVSQADNEFVIEVFGDEVTFTRGAC